MRNRCCLFLFLLSCCIFNFTFASGIWKLQGVTYKVDTLSHIVIGPGTTQTTLALEGPVKLRVFYTTTDMTNPVVNLKVITGKNLQTSYITVPNMPAYRNDAGNIYFAGVNADLFSGGGPIGTTAADGELYKTYRGTDWYAIAVDKDKKLNSGATFATFRMFSPNAGQASIKAVNVVRSSSADLVLYTSRYGSSTGTKGVGVEVGAVAVDGPLQADGTTKMRVTVAPVENNGNMPIPVGGFVLSGTGFNMDKLKQMQLGEEFEVTPTLYLGTAEKTGLVEIAGGCPMLLQGGVILNTQGALDHLSWREPRTAIGYNSNNSKAILLVVDGRQPGVSEGVLSKDLAAIMLNVGCTEALNFDGGGSSTLYVRELGVVNIPSEKGVLRAVKNGLFITTPATDDKTIARIRFADYAKEVEANHSYSPVIYGYNAQDVLIDTNVQGITLSCDADWGEVRAEGTTVLCKGLGTHTLTASLGEHTATVQITVKKSTGVGILSMTADPGINLYPNPLKAGEKAYVDFEGNAKFCIYNATGRLESSFYCEQHERASVGLPTELLMPGFYIISVSGEGSHKVAKLIIESR